MKIYITGLGCISSIGHNVEHNFESLKNESIGIKKPKFFESRYASQLMFGEVNLSNEELKSMLRLDILKGLTRTDLLAFKAFDEAVKDAQLSDEDISSKKTAFISASTVGGMCLTTQLYNDSKNLSDTKEFLESYSLYSHSLRIAKEYGLKGYVDVINTACSSSANAIMLGAKLIKSGRVDRAIVGGVDSLAKYTVNGFSSLQILSKDICKPFSKNRDGLNLGEAAAYLVLEGEESSESKNKYGTILGYGNANDAFHPSALSDDGKGVRKSINDALKSANIKPEQVDYINCHGTGTGNNDEVELRSLSEIFENIPPFNSLKTYVGHTLGASGVIEALYSLLSIKYNLIFGQVSFEGAMDEFEKEPVVKAVNKKIDIVMSNSYGFSGNCTSLILGGI